jgi:hypothetical protein
MIEREVMKGDEKSAHTAPSIEYVIAMPADVVELRAAAKKPVSPTRRNQTRSSSCQQDSRASSEEGPLSSH